MAQLLKIFHVTAIQSLGRMKPSLVHILFEEQAILFIKKVGKEERRKQYAMCNISALSKEEKEPKQASITFKDTSLHKKVILFQNEEERNLFYDICHICSIFHQNGLRMLSNAVELFKKWDSNNNGLLNPDVCAEALNLPIDEEFSMISFDHFFLMFVKTQSSSDLNIESKTTTERPASMSVSTAPNTSSGLELLIDFKMLKGEVIYMKQLNATRIDGELSWKGSFVFTNYRLHFGEYRAHGMNVGSIDIPLGWVNRTEVGTLTLTVFLKQLVKIVFVFDTSQQWVIGLNDVLKKEAFPVNADQTNCFAFQYATDLELNDNGWNIFDPVSEYHRMGFDSSDIDFRISTMNLDYKVCSTYPRFLVVPRNLTDEEIAKGAEHRSRSRFPAIVYRWPETGATLSRCSQPVVGMRGKRCEEDEHLIEQIRTLNPTNNKILYFMDARPYKAAVGNTVMGKGYENSAYYKNTTLHFLNIDNIHVIRNSMQRVNDVVKVSSSTSDEHTGAVSPWMHYIRLILENSVRICKMMSEEGASVVIHCSDGWDRTSQLSALIILMFDPSVRTRRGFALLIEKEWLSFGHKFAERNGHCDDRYTDEQRAPIFDQFIECVWQILRQFPLSFEFNEKFLLHIIDHTKSLKYGTFLFNCDRERYEAGLARKTVSLWTELCHDNNKALYSNPLYVRNEEPLYPNCSHRHLQLWEGYHYRFMTNQRLFETSDIIVSGIYAKYIELRELAIQSGIDITELDAKHNLVSQESLEQQNKQQTEEIKTKLAVLRAKHSRYEIRDSHAQEHDAKKKSLRVRSQSVPVDSEIAISRPAKNLCVTETFPEIVEEGEEEVQAEDNDD